MVAERVGNAEFGNIHQSTLSIPGVARKGIKSWRSAGGGVQSLKLHISWWNVGQVLAAVSPPSLFTTETPSASARQTPACTGAAHRRRRGGGGGGGVERRGQRKRGSTAERRGKLDEQMMDRADVEEQRKECSSGESALRLRKSVTGLGLHWWRRGVFKSKGAWSAAYGATAIGCFREGCPDSGRVGGRRAGAGGVYQLVSSHSHSIAKHRDGQTPRRDRWTDEEYLFGDSLCLHGEVGEKAGEEAVDWRRFKGALRFRTRLQS